MGIEGNFRSDKNPLDVAISAFEQNYKPKPSHTETIDGSTVKIFRTETPNTFSLYVDNRSFIVSRDTTGNLDITETTEAYDEGETAIPKTLITRALHNSYLV
jgi:hypothetical protein